ncbi:MAG: type II toxin-antitoxin system HicB family antitoxin [Oscillospiraceae bacterium]|jgi:predicted RNase H-like HicB family nuclease|nr:type II toxin-antitoxin system HicB family antitoxin [Oscillospiraceae bacterium]
MKMKYVYPAVFTREERGFFVKFPDIQPCYTEGATLEEAVIMAKDVLERRIEEVLERGEALPAASDIDSLAGGSDKKAAIKKPDSAIKKPDNFIAIQTYL